MEVLQWYADPVRSATLTFAQTASIASLLPRYGVSTASPERYILGRLRRDPALQVMERIQEQGTVEPPTVDVPVLMQRQFQQSQVVREPGGASDPVHRHSAELSICDAEMGTHSVTCAENQ